eukprot:CAMPEP_0195527096 /NCGR_PEP_ID=MMETSP0794_2-20130614/28550_1 /TAXON_ID=515487 /ORGANISM="Stephanopyxis turris, Strain CCMP 815" /LENGTH=490 /DNA_ID=CAMNT_0040657927 /DNA_START=227 /DNA_END=1699 /DNA_ORIENTATION=+
MTSYISRRRGEKERPQGTGSGLKLCILLLALWYIAGFLSLVRYDRQSRSNGTSVGTAESSSIELATTHDGNPPVVIAYAVSLIKCSKAGMTTGFLDAAAILRHSIHKQSVHSNRGKYSYKMYAIVHEQCKQHAPALETLGYTALVRDTPVKLEEMKGEYFRTHVENENCCGSAEFIKLYAYLILDHPIVVHLDMDYAILQPMDQLYDAMLFDKDSARGKAAREGLEREFPEDPLPDKIDAFITRDVTSSNPWSSRMVMQGGFIVNRPSQTDFDKYIDIIKEGNVTGGKGGWENMGYGGQQGALAYQGIVAYFYDRFRPDVFVDLNVCRWNQVVADVIWRGPDKKEYDGVCRKYPRPGQPAVDLSDAKYKQCEDCRVTPPELVKTMHYTACKKPWECLVPTPRVPRNKAQVYRLSHLTNITTCASMHKKWFELRRDFEDQLFKVTNGNAQYSNRDGEYEKKSFLGYCQGRGAYIAMEPPPDNFDMTTMYGL